MPAKGPVPGPHACTPAPTARGQRTPTACPKDGQPGEGERLTPDAPHEGTRRPPPATPSCHPLSAQRQLARACAMGSVPGPHTGTPRTQETWATGPGYLPQGRAAGRGKACNPRRPSQRREEPPPGRPLATPAARNAQHSTQAKGPVLGPHACTPSPTTCGQRTPATCPKDGQPGEGEGLAPRRPPRRHEAPRGDALLPLPQRATPACKSVRSGVGAAPSYPQPPHPRDTGDGPRLPAPRTGSRERESA